MDVRWTILCGLLAIPALMAAALTWIQVQDFRLRSWRPASGRIVSSKPVARTVRTERHRATGSPGHTDFVTDETIETRNFADVAYEFTIAGTTHHGSRIDLGVDAGNFEVAETLKRYPPGKTVTVFYDPDHPEQCVLERDDPKNLRAGWFAVVVLVGLIVGGVFGVDRLAELVRGAIDRPKHAPLVVALGLFGAVVALFARMVGRKARAMRAWTKTAGQIMQSAVETTVRTHDKPWSLQGKTTETIYVPRIVYKYDAGGISLQGDDIGGAWSGSTPATAEKYVARFPLNAVVVVFFNPDNPTESTLNPNAGYIAIILWTIAVLLGAAALVAADIVPGFVSR